MGEELKVDGAMPQMQEQYFLDQDNSCHWYLVPVPKREEWREWCGIAEDEDDPRGWDTPSFAVALGGGPQCVTFSQPMIGDRMAVPHA